MANFPTSIIGPSTITPQKPEENTISTSFEDGFIQTRKRYTRIRKAWKLSWQYIRAVDYNTLYDHYTQVCMADSFSWTNTLTNVTYTVRYTDFTDLSTDTGAWYDNFSLTLEEV